MGNRHAVDGIALRHLNLDELRLAVGEGVNLKGSRQIENSGCLLGCLKLGIDNHGKTQLVPEVADLLAVIGRSYPCNRTAVTHLLGNRTAEQVELVGIRNRDDKVSVLNSRFHLNTVAGTVAHYAHDVIEVGEALNLLRILVYYGNVMTLLAQLLHERSSDLAAADDNNIQAILIIVMSKHVCLHSDGW